MTDPTYNAESHHTPESRERDARVVGHEPKGETMTDDPKCEAGCISYYGGEKKHHRDCPYYPESLTKLNADRIEALLAERDALEAENQRLREALLVYADPCDETETKPCGYEGSMCCMTARAALKGDSHD